MEDVSFKMMGHWGHLDMYKWSYGQKFTCKFVKFWAYVELFSKLQVKWTFRILYTKYAECHSWDMSNSNATKYHEIKVGILDNTCFKENVSTFEILVGWILRLGLNFWVINVTLYGWKCDPAYQRISFNDGPVFHAGNTCSCVAAGLIKKKKGTSPS